MTLICRGPFSSFLQNMSDGLGKWGVLVENVHSGNLRLSRCDNPWYRTGWSHASSASRTAGSGPAVSFARSGITAAWDPEFRSLLELAEACDVPVDGPAGPASVIPA